MSDLIQTDGLPKLYREARALTDLLVEKTGRAVARPCRSRGPVADASILRVGMLPVLTPEVLLLWQDAMLRQSGAARHWRNDLRFAYINHGRWLVRCVACDRPLFTHPVWRLACCGSCGAVHTDVVFPAEAAEIVRLLALRPVSARNWTLGETVAALVRENARYLKGR